MELRHCSNLFFIQTIRNGVIIRVPNIDSGGRSRCVLKDLKDIFDAEDAKRPCQSIEEEKTSSGPVLHELNCSGCNDERDGDLDDVIFSRMSLKQLKESCKQKKRKLSNTVYRTQHNSVCSSDLKHLNPALNSDEDEFDFGKPLSSLKLKCSKSSKPKRICRPLKIEAQGSDDSDCQNTDCVANGSPANYIEQSDLSRDVSKEMLGNDTGCRWEIESGSFTEKSQYCTSNEACDESLDQYEPTCSIEQWGLLGEAFGEMLENKDACLLEAEAVSLRDKPQICVINEVLDDAFNQYEPASCLPVNAICEETMVLNNLEKTGDRSSALPSMEFKEEEYMEMTSAETKLPIKDNHSDDFLNQEISCQFNSNDDIAVPDVTSGDCMECNYQALPPNLEVNATSVPISNFNFSCNFPPYSNTKDGLASVHVNESPIMEARQILISASAETAVCAYNNSRLASGELTTGEVINCDDSEQRHPPKRLLSIRQAISPNSQEKLRRAMDSIEMNTGYKCKGKLRFGKQIDVKTSSIRSNMQTTKRPKTSKGILNGTQLSRALPLVNSGCISVHKCSESAIKFSKRQMQDIEGLMMMLTQELKSMKNIVEETLNTDSFPDNSLNFNGDDVRRAIKTATKAEETSTRWLSMMARDCDRFCKIMQRLTEMDNVPSLNKLHKEKKEKKITFADEIGDPLCHVKVYKDDLPSSPLGSETEKVEVKSQ